MGTTAAGKVVIAQMSLSRKSLNYKDTSLPTATVSITGPLA